MIFQNYEKSYMENFFKSLIGKNTDMVFVWKNKYKFTVALNCWYDSDNGLEEDDTNYREYNALAVLIKSIDIESKNDDIHVDDLYEISYKNIPDMVLDINGKIIYQK